MNDIIISLNHHQIVKILKSTEKLFYYCSPGIHQDMAEAILSAAKNIHNIKIIIDPSEDNFRNGYSDIKAFNMLKENSVQIYEHQNNMVSFLIADEKGYFLFPQSRIFSEQGRGNNAVVMDKFILQQIKNFYFPPENQLEKRERTDELLDGFNEMKDEYKKMSDSISFDKLESPVERIDEEKLQIVQKNLKTNPPLNPDLKRQISTYQSKIQFVDLKFNGANIHSKKVQIPVDALPINDAQLKKELETRINLFMDLKNKPEFRFMFEIKQSVDNLRKEFLVSIKCREMSIISLTRKRDFLETFEVLKQQIEDYKKQLHSLLEREALNSIDRIKSELKEFLTKNPPIEIQKYDNDLLNRKIELMVNQVTSRIKYDSPKKYLTEMSLNVNFFDLTFEDFKSEDFLNELKEKEVLAQNDLDEIVHIKSAFEAKV